MFFLPINTDAPVYHWPWATLSLIVVNAVVCLASATGVIPPETLQSLMLAYGDGLHPLQWVTSLFLHEGIVHLLGNMFFLWGFGIVVEGKIGWQRFLIVYLMLGIAESALEQVLFQGSQGYSLGASSAIFGVMAMALVWAPRNDLTIFYGVFLLFAFFRVGMVEVTILTFSLLVIVKEAVLGWMLDQHAGVAVVHLLGAALGFVLGVAMLKVRSVDCEGWDLFSVFQGKHRQSTPGGLPATSYRYVDEAWQDLDVQAKHSRRKRRRSSGGKTDTDSDMPVAEATRNGHGIDRMRALLSQHKYQAALTELQYLQHVQESFQLPRRELACLAKGLCDDSNWDDGIVLLEEYVERFPEQSEKVRIEAARLLLQKQQRPRAALRLIDPVDRSRLSKRSEQLCAAIERSAHESIDSGVIELSGRAWK